MKYFRLSYPAHIYATVLASSQEEARKHFAEILDDLIDGIDIDLGNSCALEERLYPDSGLVGSAAAELVSVENIEDEE